MKRRRTAQEQKSVDDQRLLRAWKNWHAEQLKEALAGVHRDVLGRVMAQLKDLRSARELVDALLAEDWSVVSADVRLIVLHEINCAITKLRERANPVEPIDDAINNEPLNAFQIIRAMINKFPAQVGKRPRLSANMKRKEFNHE
jgi:hypothetical protein